MFGCTSAHERDVLKSEPVAMAGRLQPRYPTDENDCTVDPLSLAELREIPRRCRVYHRQSRTWSRCWYQIDGIVQPTLSLGGSSHGSISHGVIRISATCWL